MKYKILSIIFLIFSLSVKSFSQENSNLFNFDFAQFAYDSTENYLQLYYAINQSALTLHRTDSSYTVAGLLNISFVDTATGKSYLNKSWKLMYPVEDTSKAAEKNLVGLLNFALPKGIYKCTVKVADQFNIKNTKSDSDFIRVKPYDKDSLAISDIQLASRIIQDSPNKNSIFYKNTFEVTPIPNLVFGENIPVLFYYYEVYDPYGKKKEVPLQIFSTIVNSRGKVYYNKKMDITRGVPSRAEVGSIPINKYPTDTYTLRIGLLDSVKNSGMISSKRFFVYNPDVKSLDTANAQPSKVLSSLFGLMSIEECNDLFAKAKYIATTNEISQWSKLQTVQGKREFLYNFWKERNPDPASPQNEFYHKYMERVKEADQKYGSLNKPGWKTDRGRVLLIYGEPSEIDRYPNETNTKPYEIWHYNDIQGGVIFVFADLTGFSDYQLINSTARGEIRDDNWQSRITTTSY